MLQTSCKMVIKSYSCLLIFLLSTTIVVDSCSKSSSGKPRKPRVPKPATNQSISVSQTTNSPTTSKYVPVMIRTKEMLIFPIKGHRLDKFSFIETRVGSIMECAHLCLRENGQCLSVNIEKTTSNGGYKCELNNSTKKNHVKNFLQNAAYSYFEPINVCVYFPSLILSNQRYLIAIIIYFAFPGLGQW